ncbi:MAG: hypothetical protein LC623_03720 [Halobacteriales archaeon]|nr:hypothetical protein [Halobacteriales archaeon]
MNVNLGLLTLSALMLAAPLASAGPSPPPGSTDNCLGGGYNPDALANVCLGDGPSTPDHTGTVGTTPGPCVIGETCVPVPTYDPNGGMTIPSVSLPAISYVDVNTPLVFCESPNDHPWTGTSLAMCVAGADAGTYGSVRVVAEQGDVLCVTLSVASERLLYGCQL